MRKSILFTTACLMATASLAENTDTQPRDTTKVIDIEEVVIIASPKETGKLRELPAAASLISQKEMRARQITSLKSVSSLMPTSSSPTTGRASPRPYTSAE